MQYGNGSDEFIPRCAGRRADRCVEPLRERR